MDKNLNYIPYNSKMSEEELKSLCFDTNIKGSYNIIDINDYNNIIRSFNEKIEKEQYLQKNAQEKEKLRLKGQILADRIKSKSMGKTSVYERIEERERKKEEEKQKIDEEWRKVIENERKEMEKKIEEKKFNARNDVFEFNKKIQESNMYYERQLQIELKKKRREIKDKLDKEFEKNQLDHLKSELLYEKIQEHKNKLKEIEAGKKIKEQILQNEELRKQMRKEEEEAILNSKGLIFDPEKTEEEKREELKKLYADIDKQIQLKNKLKNKQLEDEKKLDSDILEFNNNKSFIEEKIANARREDINQRIKNSELAGKNIGKSERKDKIKNFYELISNKDPIFNDKEDIILRNQFKKHFNDNSLYQLKQIEESKKLREKEKKETKQYYYEKGVKAFNELKEEEAKRVEKEKLLNLEQMKINEELIKEKEKRLMERENSDKYRYNKSIEEEKKKDDDDFNNYVLRCISELELKGRDTRNLYSSLITDKEKITKSDIDCLPDTFRRLGINGIHNADDDLLSSLQKKIK